MQVCARLVLILALLACPLNCMGALSRVDAPNERPSACGCCAHQTAKRDSTPARVPHSPDDDCQCPTCLCNGAVLLADDVAFDLNPIGEHVLAEMWIGDLLGASAAKSLACTDWWLDQSIHQPTGRAARILYQSFLL